MDLNILLFKGGGQGHGVSLFPGYFRFTFYPQLCCVLDLVSPTQWNVGKKLCKETQNFVYQSIIKISLWKLNKQYPIWYGREMQQMFENVWKVPNAWKWARSIEELRRKHFPGGKKIPFTTTTTITIAPLWSICTHPFTQMPKQHIIKHDYVCCWWCCLLTVASMPSQSKQSLSSIQFIHPVIQVRTSHIKSS